MLNKLSAPQNIFLNKLNTKFKAYVGGYGCIRGSTKIHTINGLVPISDINQPVHVLSFDASSNQFVWRLSGGAFPKGIDYLYWVSTTAGEFVANGFHQVFCADGKYQQVKDLSVGHEVFASFQSQPSTSEEHGQKLCAEDALCYSQRLANSMGSYADAARQYGQQFLKEASVGQAAAQQPAGAQVSGQRFDYFDNGRADDQAEQKQAHSHHDQSSGHRQTLDYLTPLLHLVSVLANHVLPLVFARIFAGILPAVQFLSNSFCHHKAKRSDQYHTSYTCPLTKATILAIERLEEREVFYDMQVDGLSNYVCENGFIHHNSGKTFVGCLFLLLFFCRYPKTRQAYFAPSYPQIRDIFYPTFEEAAHMFGFTCKVHETNHEVHVYRGRAYYGTVICRSMDNPASIVGFKVVNAMIDEIDTLPKDKAKKVWDKIIARLRLVIVGVQNQVAVSTTPEGFHFVYDTFYKDPSKSYSMVQASSYENQEHLPEDYIPSLIETYTEKLVLAYVNGQFVNLKSGTVYGNFDRVLNDTKVTQDGREPLHIGMDFNVGNMSGIVHVIRNGQPHAVDEMTGIFDTPAMIHAINTQFRQEPGRSIAIYPDASGNNRKSNNASETDISLLQDAGFAVYNEAANPAVRDRVNAMNAAFCNGKGERHYKVNVDRCPKYAANLEQQAYNKFGEPDKSHGVDHTNDAGGYFICNKYPIVRPVTKFEVRF